MGSFHFILSCRALRLTPFSLYGRMCHLLSARPFRPRPWSIPTRPSSAPLRLAHWYHLNFNLLCHNGSSNSIRASNGINAFNRYRAVYWVSKQNSHEFLK
jgi:hypothetical protein